MNCRQRLTGYPYYVERWLRVLTKRDAAKAADQAARVAATLDALRKHVAAFPEVIFTSARSGEGVAELRAHIARLLAERGPDRAF